MDNNNNLAFKKMILSNGIKVIAYQRKEIHSINLSVVVNVGSLDEDKSNNGISHMIEHLAFDGTRDFKSWEDVDRFLNNISGSGNASTSMEHTRYYGTFPHQFLEESLYYYSQLVFFPTHEDAAIEKERVIIIDEMKRYDDTVEEKIYENIFENRFENPDTSFSMKIIGTEDNLKKFNRTHIREQYEKYYVPSNVEIYIVGNFDFDKLETYLEKYFVEEIKGIKNNDKPERNFKKTYPGYSQFNIAAKQKLDLDQYYLTLTFPTLEFAFNDQAQRKLTSFLRSVTASGQYQQSILWKRLREELGLVYGIGAYEYGLFNRAFIEIETSFQPEFLDQVIFEIYSGIEKIKKGEITSEVFEAKRKRSIDTHLMNFDEPTNILDWIISQDEEMDHHGKSLTLDGYLEMIKGYKFEDIAKLATELFDWDKVNISIVSSKDKKIAKEEVAQAWERAKGIQVNA